MPLHAVPGYERDDDVIDADVLSDTHAPTGTPARLPNFEGQPVEYALVRLASATKLDVGDNPHHVDDMVRVVVEGRVTNVNHVLDAAGRLVRVHTIKVADATEISWDVDIPNF